MGGHQLLFYLSHPLDTPYSVELRCTFDGHVELNTCLHFGEKHSWTHSQTMFPLFLKGYDYNRQFVIVQERVAVMPNVILSIGQDCIGRNPKIAEP